MQFGYSVLLLLFTVILQLILGVCMLHYCKRLQCGMIAPLLSVVNITDFEEPQSLMQ